jgi:acylphosphatase
MSMTSFRNGHQRLSARVYGVVQGVGFRHFTRSRARDLGLDGWIRNEPDGSVRLVAEGTRDNLDALLDAVRRGPSSARVRDVNVDWGAATGAFDGFSVRYF